MKKWINTPENYNAPKTKIDYVLPAIVSIMFAIIIINRGGFFANINLIMSVVAVVILIVIAIVKKNIHFNSSSILLVLLSILYSISMLCNSVIVTSLMSVTNMVSLIPIAILIGQLDDSRKWDAFIGITIIGIAFGIWGILMNFDITPFLGGKDDVALEFVFQYANASGVYFAIIILGCFYVFKKWLKLLAILPAISLFFTVAAGTNIVLAFITLLFGAIAIHKSGKIKKFSSVKQIYVIIACLILSALAVVVWVTMFKIPQTFVERFIQIYDTCRILAAHIFGAGPDTWQFIYPYIQSAQYEALKVHCSYMQIALDGGIFAIIAIIVFLTLSIIKLIKNRQTWRIACALLIILHAVFDFDFSFSALFLLLLFFVDEQIVFQKKLIPFAAVAVCVVAAMISAPFGFNYFLDISNAKSAVEDVKAGMQPPNLSLLPSYLQDDPKIRADITAACSTVKGNTYVLNNQATLSKEESWYKAYAFGKAGKLDTAYNILLSELSKLPYPYQYANMVREYLLSNNAGKEVIEKFNQIATNRNEAITKKPASFLPNQKQIELINY